MDNLRNSFATRALSVESSLTGKDFDCLLQETATMLKEKQHRLDLMFEHFDQVGLGATFRNEEQYAFVIRDASAKGLYRCQLFDKRGFYGHSTFSSTDEVLVELCDTGFCSPASRDTIDILSKTQDWLLGMEAAAMCQAVNSGILSMDEAQLKYAAFKLENYEMASAA